MKRYPCSPSINRPPLPQPWIEADEKDERLGREIAIEIARVIAKAGAEDRPRDRTDCLAELARDRLARMTPRGRRSALLAASRLAGSQTRADGPGLSEPLRKGIGEMAKRHFATQRRAISRAIRAVAAQAKPLRWIRTTVGMRPAGEIVVRLVRHTCLAFPESLVFEWESAEPGAARAYWELRGPATQDHPGRLLARGYSENTRESGPAGGSFELELSRYLPAQTPDPTQRYTVRVLPLAEPQAGISFGVHRGHSLSVLSESEPEPPIGIGPWSAPAEIEYGVTCQGPGTVFDIDDVTYYQNVAIKVNWFRVDADQPGPGDEEYHLHAFVVEYTPQSAAKIGTFGAYMPVDEDDRSKHPLHWETWNHTLSSPLTNLWPRYYMVVLSVVEEDAGDEMDEWRELMAELAEEALEGDIRDAIQDALEDVREEIDEANAELEETLRKELLAYVGALIGASALNAAAAIAAFAVAIIQAFARAGAGDDFFGVKTVTFIITDNDVEKIADGSGWSVQGGLSGGSATGTESDGRFETAEAEVQLVALPGPDTPGLNGIVSFGLSMELYNPKTIYR